MAKSNKSKWIIGLTGTALSAFVITQIGTNQPNEGSAASQTVDMKSMSTQEKEYVQLDWSNYAINGTSVSASVQGGVQQSDRQTRRS